MAEIRLIDDPPAGVTLDDYAADPKFAAAIADLRAEAAQGAAVLRDRTVWMINSTAAGGGVAEMLPRLIGTLNELGVPTRWGVLETDREDFFRLTKRLHNLIHGDDSGGDLAGDPHACEALARSAQRRVYDEFLLFRQVARYLRLLGGPFAEERRQTARLRRRRR